MDQLFHDGTKISLGAFDVSIKIEKHPLFRKVGLDIIHEKQITAEQAKSGVSLTLHDLDGDVFPVDLTPQTLPKKEFSLSFPGAGMKSRGSLIVEFLVV